MMAMLNDREFMQAYSKAMSPFVVIRAEYDIVTECYEQVIWDPQKIVIKDEVGPNDVIPEYKVFVSSMYPVNAFDPKYMVYLTPRQIET